jgi:hypothetical protein
VITHLPKAIKGCGWIYTATNGREFRIEKSGNVYVVDGLPYEGTFFWGRYTSLEGAIHAAEDATIANQN